VTKPGSVCLLS